MKRNWMVILLMSVLMAANGQVTRQGFAITGTVKDENGSPLAGAHLHLLNTAFETSSANDGSFTFTQVHAGIYTLNVTADGFAGITTMININDGAVVIDLQLKSATVNLSELVVTSQKREEPGRQLPVAFAVIDSKRIAELRLWNSRELTAVVPNLYAGNPGDGRNVTSIRGLVSTSYDPAVTTYIDGVAQFNLDTYIPQLFDVDRIEILRGPQGTLYGRNSTGGVINIISKQPVAGTSGFAEAGLGNYGQQRYTAGIKTMLVRDHLFAGVAGLYEKLDGYFTNEYKGGDFDRQHTAAGSYWLKYLSGKRWKADLNVKHLASRNDGAFPLAGSIADAMDHPYQLSQDAVARLVDNTLNGSLSFTWSLPGVNIVSQTAYQSNYRYYKTPIDGDFSPIDGITIINNYGNKFNRVKAYTQELRVSSANSISAFNWTGGIFLFSQRSPNKQATHFGEDAAMVGSPDINYSIVNTNTFRNRGAAAFGQFDYRIIPQLVLTGGLRIDHQLAKARILGEYLPDGSPSPVFETQPDTSAKRKYMAVSPKLALSYTAGKSSIVYASYARGFRTGGLTQLASDPSQPPLFGYDPEYSDNAELGFRKTMSGSRVRLDVNAFYSIVSDVQVPTLVLPDAVTITRNAGRLKSRGIETSIEALIAKGISLSYNFGYTRARYTRLELSQSGSSVNLKGNKQVFTPDYTSMLAIQYALTLDKRSGLAFTIRGEWLAIGETFFDYSNNTRQAPYQLLNARAGFSMKHVELMCWMRNLADKRFITYGYEFGAVHTGDPRTVGVTLRGTF